MTRPRTQLDSPGILFVMNDIATELEPEFNRWYQGQHVPERMAIAGFQTARRYRALGPSQAYMAIYECDSVEVLEKPVYRERIEHPTEWTLKMMPHFRNTVRSVCHETFARGASIGAEVVVLRGSCTPGRETAVRSFVDQTLYPLFAQADCLARLALWEAAKSALATASPEEAFRGRADERVDWVLFFETYQLSACEQLLAQSTTQQALRQAGWHTQAQASYRLMSAFRGQA